MVLDANVLIRDFWMTGSSFSYLLTHQFLQHRPAIPEVALLEARNQLKQRAEALLANRTAEGEGSRGNTLRLLRLFNYKRLPPRSEWHIEKMLSRWDKHVARVLKRFGGLVIPNPNVDLREITKRSIERRKPFTAGDKGFRDTLIWLSTLTLIGPDSRVSFVTGNTSDFFAGESADPHPDLLAEAEIKLRGEWKLLFHRSLDDFIARFDSDRQTSAEALKRALISKSMSGFDLWEWLEGNLRRMLEDYEFDEVAWAGVPHDAEAPMLVEVEQIVGIDIPRVKHVAEDVYRLYCDLAFVGVFTCVIGYNPAETIVHPNQILWKDETDDFWTDIGMRIAATGLIALDFDVQERDVVEYYWHTLHHWRSYGEVVEELEDMRQEIQALEPTSTTD
jgi:hypothetical protein